MLSCQDIHKREGVFICKIAANITGIPVGCTENLCNICNGTNQDVIKKVCLLGMKIGIIHPINKLKERGRFISKEKELEWEDTVLKAREFYTLLKEVRNDNKKAKSEMQGTLLIAAKHGVNEISLMNITKDLKLDNKGSI